jgi:nicotinamide mononucleotide transporter
MRKVGTLVVLLAMLAAIAVYTSSTMLETVATTTGLLCVWLTAREHIWAWPIGLVNVGCFFFMFQDAKLYADMMLQIVFFVLGVYGWIVWLTKRAGSKVRPTRKITRRLALVLTAVFAGCTVLWGYVLHTYTDASIPYVDALIATLSIIAQYLLSSKVLENWLVWIAVDVMSIAMYMVKDLHTVAFLYAIYLLIAISGYISWRKEWIAHEGRSMSA